MFIITAYAINRTRSSPLVFSTTTALSNNKKSVRRNVGMILGFNRKSQRNAKVYLYLISRKTNNSLQSIGIRDYYPNMNIIFKNRDRIHIIVYTKGDFSNGMSIYVNGVNFGHHFQLVE